MLYDQMIETELSQFSCVDKRNIPYEWDKLKNI